MRLQHKVCIVTGGGSGLGRATCLLFARERAALVIADRNAEAARAVAQEVDGDALALAVEVPSPDECRRMVEVTLERFGRVDVLVNNAGYGITGSVVEIDEGDWDALMATNLKDVFCKGSMLTVDGGVTAR